MDRGESGYGWFTGLKGHSDEKKSEKDFMTVNWRVFGTYAENVVTKFITEGIKNEIQKAQVEVMRAKGDKVASLQGRYEGLKYIQDKLNRLNDLYLKIKK